MPTPIFRAGQAPVWRERMSWWRQENYIVYFNQDESNCSITVRALVHVARQFP